MNAKIVRIIILLVAFLVSAQTAFCATTKPKPKPKPKPTTATTSGVVIVTTPLKGENAQIGTEYTLGKTDPMNILMRSMEFTTSRIRIGDEIYYPKGSEKFLLLHYTIRNPQKSEKTVDWATFQFTAVDATNTNREYSEHVGIESNSQALKMDLKPAQKIDVYTFIAVPAKGTVPKLIVKGSDDLVLRYYPKDKIKPLTGPTADPTDTTGATALTTVPAKMGETYQTGWFDFRIDNAQYTTTPIVDQEMEENSRNLVFDITVKNCGFAPFTLDWGTFTFKLVDQDGLEIGWNESLLSKNKDVELSTRADPGQEIKARIYFMIPNGSSPKTLSVFEGDEGRVFAYDVSAVK